MESDLVKSEIFNWIFQYSRQELSSSRSDTASYLAASAICFKLESDKEIGFESHSTSSSPSPSNSIMHPEPLYIQALYLLKNMEQLENLQLDIDTALQALEHIEFVRKKAYKLLSKNCRQDFLQHQDESKQLLKQFKASSKFLKRWHIMRSLQTIVEQQDSQQDQSLQQLRLEINRIYRKDSSNESDTLQQYIDKISKYKIDKKKVYLGRLFTSVFPGVQTQTELVNHYVKSSLDKIKLVENYAISETFGDVDYTKTVISRVSGVQQIIIRWLDFIMMINGNLS